MRDFDAEVATLDAYADEVSGVEVVFGVDVGEDWVAVFAQAAAGGAFGD